MTLSPVRIRFHGVFMLVGILVVSLFLVGCVTKSEKEARKSRSTIQKQQSIIDQQNRELRSQDNQLYRYEQLRADLSERIELLENEQNTLDRMLDDVHEKLRQSRRLVRKLSVEGQQAKKDRARVLDQLDRVNNELAESDYKHNEHIEVLSKRINQMRTQRNRANNRANRKNRALREEISQIKQVNARLEGERLILTMDSRLLFDLGKADLKPESRQVLDRIANSFSEFPNRPIVVEGHTDSLPVKNSEFQSNWHLSSARAISVVKYFIERHRISANRMTPSGYGEHRPIRPNTSAENRQQNRRVEIVLYPENLMRVSR